MSSRRRSPPEDSLGAGGRATQDRDRIAAGGASFQARSAFSRAGFTTTEAENVVNHPIRRRIIASTIFVGALGTPTLVVTVLFGLLAPGPGGTGPGWP